MRRPKGLECRVLNGKKKYRVNTSIKGCKVKGRFTTLFFAAIELKAAKEGISDYIANGNPKQPLKLICEINRRHK